MMIPFNQRYADYLHQLISNTSVDKVITPKNVFQEGIPTNKNIISKIVNELMLPGSRMIGFENLFQLYNQAEQGKSCLLLMEHYSNFDIPNLYAVLEKEGEKGLKVADAIISIAGLKLNEEDDVVRSFTEAFTRLVIYPSSGLKSTTDPEERKKAEKKRAQINKAALWQLFWLKNKKRIILVFPTGTRYRPWDPSTKRGLKEVYPYIKSFNYMVLVAINGNTLRLNPDGKRMPDDLTTEDVILYTVSRVYDCKEYRKKIMQSVADDDIDRKQYVIDQIMNEMEGMHQESEKQRQKILKELGKKTE